MSGFCSLCKHLLQFFFGYMGASMVKWIAPDPCLVFSESDSNYTLTLNFVKNKYHRHFSKIPIYKAKQIVKTKRKRKRKNKIKITPRKIYRF